jgi:hypothetical protein
MSSNTAARKKVTKNPAKPSEHPPVAAMVKAAITSLKDRKGSSLAAIKKYILISYKGIDMVRVAPFIRRYLKKAIGDGEYLQVKGSYKMVSKAKQEDMPKKESKPAVKKPKKGTTPKKTVVKKHVANKSPKKVAKKTAAKKSPKALEKKVKKTPTKKPSVKKAIKKPSLKAATKK